MNKLFLFRRIGPTSGYEYDSFVVCAPTEEAARQLFNKPGRFSNHCGEECLDPDKYSRDSAHNCLWADPERATCTLIGTAEESQPVQVLIGSFNPP